MARKRPKGKELLKLVKLRKGEDRAEKIEGRTRGSGERPGGSSWRRRLPQDLVELVISPFRIGNVVAQAAKGAETESASKDSRR
jgi:hypothetical protein